MSDELSVEIVRPVEADARLVMEWRNDPQTLASFYHREPKVWDRFWPEFQRDYFADPELPALFLLRDGKRVAFCRFQRAVHPRGEPRRCSDVSINVDPTLRGQGLGVAALELSAEVLRARAVDDIVAEIRVDNLASIRVFEKAGYVRVDRVVKHIDDTGEDCEIYRYLRTLS